MFTEGSANSLYKNLKYPEIHRYQTKLLESTPDELNKLFFQTIKDTPELQKDEERIREKYDSLKIDYQGLKRKQSKHPSIVHAERSSLIFLKMLQLTDREITADKFIGILYHDRIEDIKDATHDSVVRLTGRKAARYVNALTREKLPSGKRLPVRKTVKKIKEAASVGVEDVIPAKTADKYDNVTDQPNVHRPLRREKILFLTKEYRQSDYGKWGKLKRKTLVAFIPGLLLNEPKLQRVLFEGITVTDRKIKQRPRQSIRTKTFSGR